MNLLRGKRRVLLAALLLAGTGTGHGIVIYNYSPAEHNRFSGGYSGSPVTNGNFSLRTYDFSGVGWQTDTDNKSVAMISPLHYVAAWHYRPAGTLTFFNRSGVLKTFGVETNFRIGITDLAIGRLTTAITPADEIAHYPILGTNVAGFLGQTIFVYGKNGSTISVGSNEIDAIGFVGSGINTVSYLYDYDITNGFNPGETIAAGGDSGNPDFTPYNGQLTIVGGKSFIYSDPPNPNGTGGAMLPYYYKEVDELLIADGYRLEIVPEPGSIVLTAGAAAFAFIRRRRQRKA
jgi:hypothetical protein